MIKKYNEDSNETEVVTEKVKKFKEYSFNGKIYWKNCGLWDLKQIYNFNGLMVNLCLKKPGSVNPIISQTSKSKSKNITKNKCYENETKTILYKKQKTETDYEIIFNTIKNLFIKNGNSYNNKNEFDEFWMEIKEFLLKSFDGIKSNLEIIIDRIKVENVYKKYQKFINIQIIELYVFLLYKGINIKSYQKSYITLLKYLLKYKKFESFKKIEVDMCSIMDLKFIFLF